MLDRILEFKDKTIDRIKSLEFIQKIEIGSGLLGIIGLGLLALSIDDELVANDIIEKYESDIIETDAEVIDTDSDDISE